MTAGDQQESLHSTDTEPVACCLSLPLLQSSVCSACHVCFELQQKHFLLQILNRHCQYLDCRASRAKVWKIFILNQYVLKLKERVVKRLKLKDLKVF